MRPSLDLIGEPVALWRKATMDERRALRRARAGHQDGYAWLFERYKGPLHRFVRRDLDADTAHDVLQEVFIRAFRSLATLREDASLEAWLLRIARRETLRALDRRRPQRMSEAELEIACDRAEEAAAKAELERLFEEIRRSLPSIEPEAVRDTAERYYLREPPCTTEALAEELGVPHATIRKRLFSFRNKLRERLRRMSDE